MDTLTLPARPDSLETFLCFVMEKAKQAGASDTLLYDIRLAAEEILTNIFFYAYPEKEGSVVLTFSSELNKEVSIEVTDWGIPFNPLAYDTPDLDRDFTEREIGGMGIYLMRNVAHRIVYQRSHDANHLTVFFRLSQDEAVSVPS